MASPRVVYRVERGANKGPYRSSTPLTSHLSDKHWLSGTHPVARLGGDPELFCGFKSLKQLFAWFDRDDCKRLACGRFRISVYTVSKVPYSDGKQIAFHLGYAKLVKTLKFSEARREM